MGLGRGRGRGRGAALNRPAWMTAAAAAGVGGVGPSPPAEAGRPAAAGGPGSSGGGVKVSRTPPSRSRSGRDGADELAASIVASVTGGGGGGGGFGPVGAARGRGRGRGTDVNRPAWMTHAAASGGGVHAAGREDRDRGGPPPSPASRRPKPDPPFRPPDRPAAVAAPMSLTSSGSVPTGIGRGRGRGRGSVDNRPAWMTRDGDGPGPGPPAPRRPSPGSGAGRGRGGGTSDRMMAPVAEPLGRDPGGRESGPLRPGWAASVDERGPAGRDGADRDGMLRRDEEKERWRREEERARHRHHEEDRRRQQEEGERHRRRRIELEGRLGIQELERLKERERTRREEDNRSKRSYEERKGGPLTERDRKKRKEEEETRKRNIEHKERKEEERRKEKKEEEKRRERKEKELQKIEQEELEQLEALAKDSLGEDLDFGTEEEREDRLARERRERRRNRRCNDVALISDTKKSNEGVGNGDCGADDDATLPTKQGNVEEKLISTHPSLDNAEDKISRPRNAAGIIESEREGLMLEEEEKKDNGGGNGTPDSFDMFSSSVSPAAGKHQTDKSEKGLNGVSENQAFRADGLRRNGVAEVDDAANYDDADGYYRSRIGEVISLPIYHCEEDDFNRTEKKDINVASFKVLGIVGKGVFSTVLKCQALNDKNAWGGSECEVAMKIIRSNETMAKAAQKEVRILRLLCGPLPRVESAKKDSAGKDDNAEENGGNDESERNHNVVRMFELVDEKHQSGKEGQGRPAAYKPASLPLLEYRNHVTLLFEHLPFNLRETLTKFGKGVGITLSATRSYARQLLRALSHLERHQIVHADIKPDNIIVSADFGTVKLCDFGSAFFETDNDNDPTPYLVSRFYRPPEVILGLEYDRAVDLWSVAVTVSELFTGTVAFPGRTNNEMLRRFMDTRGPFSNKMIRRHIASYLRLGLTPHFDTEAGPGGNFGFHKHEVDRATGRPVVRVITVTDAVPSKRMGHICLRARSTNDDRGDVLRFADLMERCLALDPGKRIGVKEARTHDFFASATRRNKT